MVKETFGNSWSSVSKGVDILYELVISEVHKGITGRYFDNDKGAFGKAHADAYNEIEINRLIDTS